PLPNPPIKPANATIHNACLFPIYLTPVSSTTPPETCLPQNTTWTEPYRHDAQTGRISLKLTTVANGLYTGAPQTIFAYNYLERPGQVWFDLSDVFGDPFRGYRVRLGPMGPMGPVGPGSGNASEMIVWEDGVPPRGSQVRVVGGEVGVGLGVC
ncbi:Bys1 family protein, partial [Aspergillus aculeatinus CBS 121060]